MQARLRDRLATLAGLPRQGRSASEDRRELSIPDVQLRVVYRVDADAVRVLRVFHTRQN